MSSYMYVVGFFCKQKTAYEMRISDWSSDVCSSDLGGDTHEKSIRPVHRMPGGRGRRVYFRRSGRGKSRLPRQPLALEDDQADPDAARTGCGLHGEIGRASCRERVCQYV